MGAEWSKADTEQRAPNWGSITIVYVEDLCQRTKAANPSWHADLNALNLSAYLQEVPIKLFWWLPQPPAAPQPTDGTFYSSTIL
jgi:hypothetical protein